MQEAKDISKIKEQVEQRLQEQQANKDFKDIGRVAQTKKEKAAFRLINSSILGQLEEDSVMAFNMVKKEAVWSEIDVNAEREKGVTSGAAFLKVKIREAVPTRPKDEKQKRAAYVSFLEFLQNGLLECYNVEQIQSFIDGKCKNMPTGDIINIFVDNTYNTLSDDEKLKLEGQIKIRFSFIYAGSLLKKLINEVFGARLENLLFNYSDAANTIWQEAKGKEPISEEKSKELIEKIKEREQKFIEANNEKIKEYKDADSQKLINVLLPNWRVDTSTYREYKKNPEIFRDYAVRYYERKIKIETESVFPEKIKKVQPRENDWSWFDAPKEREKSEKTKEQPINTKEPLSYIKRTGGYKIENYSPKGIVEKFGFSAVNYGNYVDNDWSKQHTRHFLGAMTDMAEMLNLDIKKMNELGKLSIAFGAKGRKGHAATYFPQTKDINLTKGNGDGSVAHEWGHYFDNVIVELDIKRATNNFASDGTSQDFEIKSLYKELMDFIYKGNDLYTPKVPMMFYAQKSETPPQYIVRNGYSSEQKTIEIKDTIEETLLQVEQFAVVNKDWYYTQKRLFGYIIDQFGLETYNVPMKLKTSYFYHTSAYNLFQYCFKKDEKNIEILTSVRTKYWSSAVELFARAWEAVVLKKLLDKNRISNYLVNDIPTEILVSESYYRPYPQGKELEYIESLIDKIIIAVKKKYDIGDFVEPTYVLEDEYIELNKDESGKAKNEMVVDKDVVEETKTIEFKEEDKVVDKVIDELPNVNQLEQQANEKLNEYLGSKKETFLEFYNRLKEIQSKVTYPEFAQNPPRELYRYLFDEVETWEYKISLKKAFSAGYRLKKAGKTQELLLKEAYRYFVKGELLKDKYDEEQSKETIPNVEDTKPFEQFEKIVLESNTLDEAFSKVREIKNVPYDVSVKFRETYDPNDELTPIQAFERFYNEVKSGTYKIGDEFLLGNKKVFIGESGAFGLKDEVCLYNSKDKSLIKCIGRNSFETYLEEGKITPIESEIEDILPMPNVEKRDKDEIEFKNKDLKSAIDRGQYTSEQLKKADIGYPFQNGSYILNIPTVYGGNVYHYNRKEDRLNDYNLLQKISLQNETKQTNEVLQPTKAESITDTKVSEDKQSTEERESEKSKIDTSMNKEFLKNVKTLSNKKEQDLAIMAYNVKTRKDLDNLILSINEYKQSNKEYKNTSVSDMLIGTIQYVGRFAGEENIRDILYDYYGTEKSGGWFTYASDYCNEVLDKKETREEKTEDKKMVDANLIAPKGYVFSSINSHRAREKATKIIGKENILSLGSFSHGSTAASSKIFLKESDFEKIKGIKGVGVKSNKLFDGTNYFYQRQQFGKLRDLFDKLQKDKKEPIVHETRTEEKSEQKVSKESILKKIKALQILADIGNESAKKKIKALKLLID